MTMPTPIWIDMGCGIAVRVSVNKRASFARGEKQMDRAKFQELLDRHFNAIKDMNVRKGNDYAGKDDARELQGPRAGARAPPQAGLGHLRREALGGDRDLHQGRRRAVGADRGRILDLILYLFLLLGLNEDEDMPVFQRQYYPYDEGDVTVLGPEIFVGKDEKGREVISWKGDNYIEADSTQAPDRVRRLCRTRRSDVRAARRTPPPRACGSGPAVC